MGHSAKNQQIMNFRNTIYGFRDLLGRKFSDPYVQGEIKNLPFKIVEQKDDSIGIKVSLDVWYVYDVYCFVHFSFGWIFQYLHYLQRSLLFSTLLFQTHFLSENVDCIMRYNMLATFHEM